MYSNCLSASGQVVTSTNHQNHLKANKDDCFGIHADGGDADRPFDFSQNDDRDIFLRTFRKCETWVSAFVNDDDDTGGGICVASKLLARKISELVA